MNINELSEAVHAIAVEKGWHDEPIPPAESIALMHSELSEALEELRDGRGMTEIYRNSDSPKPEGLPIEIADLVIRAADFCALHKIDLEAAIEMKVAYNRTRPHRHGKVF